MITKNEIQELLHSTETYRVERTTSTSDMDKFQEAICAFSNDLPNSHKKGYLILGAYDNGTLSGLKVTDDLLKKKTVVNYPNNAIRELMMNALMHRDYQSNMPVRLYQFDDHIEIMNAGGLYGEARPENFPTVNDYRNPIVAEAMKEMKYVNMFNQGIRRVQDMLRENGNPEAEFTVEKLTAFEVKIRPTISLNLVTDQEKVTKSETKKSDTVNKILAFCTTPRSMTEIMEHIGLKHRYNMKHRYIDPLIEGGFIEMTIPQKPNSRSQKYKRTLT